MYLELSLYFVLTCLVNRSTCQETDFEYSPALIVADWTLNDLVHVDITSGHARRYNLTNLQSPTGIAIDAQLRLLFFSDVELGIIVRMRLDGSERATIETRSPDQGSSNTKYGLTLDTTQYHVYFSDHKAEAIFRIDYDGGNKTGIIINGLRLPVDLVVDSDTRTLYWFDVGSQLLESASLDGSNRRIVMDEGIRNPESLTLEGDWLFWCDMSTRRIEGILTNGTNRTLLYEHRHRTTYPLRGLTIYQDFIYVVNSESDAVLRLPKTGGVPLEPFGDRVLKMPQNIVIYVPEASSGPSPAISNTSEPTPFAQPAKQTIHLGILLTIIWVSAILLAGVMLAIIIIKRRRSAADGSPDVDPPVSRTGSNAKLTSAADYGSTGDSPPP